MIPIIDAVVGGVGKILDKIVPDANVREQVKTELAELSLKLDQQETERQRLDVEDRISARMRETEVKDKVPSRLAYIIIGSFVCLSAFIIGHPYVSDKTLDTGMIGMIGTIIGYLSAKAEQVSSYYFGSSRGSDHKTEILDRVVNHKK